MARYVLLEFDDNTEADALIKAVQDNRLIMYSVSIEDPSDPDCGQYRVVHVEGGLNVRGLFFKPTQFCECNDPGAKSARGKKWGLWVHASCGKPKKGNWQHPRNLLDPLDMSSKQRNNYLGVIEPKPVPGEIIEYQKRHR